MLRPHSLCKPSLCNNFHAQATRMTVNACCIIALLLLLSLSLSLSLLLLLLLVLLWSSAPCKGAALAVAVTWTEFAKILRISETFPTTQSPRSLDAGSIKAARATVSIPTP